MAAALDDGYMLLMHPLMHPFFQKASIKTNGKPPTPTKSEDATSAIEETYSPGADNALYGAGTADSPISIAASQPGNHEPKIATDRRRLSKDEEERIDVGNSGDFTVDLNLDRRKRRKLRPSTEAQVLAPGEEKDWLHQLKEAAIDGPEAHPSPTFAAVLLSSESLKTRKTVSQQPVSPKKTPLRTKKNATTESPTDEAASPANAPPVASPTTKATPKKKLLKLNANGKLLSSPASISPVSKSKGRRREDEHNELLKTNRITLKYGSDQEGRSRMGMEIDEVLRKPSMSQKARLRRNNGPPKGTHPFFLSKQTQKLEPGARAGSSVASSRDQLSEADDKRSPPRTIVAWKDIVFSSQRPTFTKSVDTIGAPWPPIEMQHLGAEETPLSHPLKLYGVAASKSKEQRTQITAEEDILRKFSSFLHLEAESPTHSLRLPQRIVATGQQVLAILDGTIVSAQDEPKSSNTTHAAISRMRYLLPTSSTAFDQGKAGNGSAWTVQYAPCSANDVLQPTASLLRDWMRSLTTSGIQKTAPSPREKTAQGSKRQSRKKKRRKISTELEGFIASSEDESEGEHGSNYKNSVLISGPPGCGKTASVFAVAKELGFEVFEVHPGMRRSAKDIIDKVGDMTQNHLVQGLGNGMAAAPDPNTIDIDSTNHEIASGKQGTVNKFFSKTQTCKQRKSPRKNSGKKVENAKVPKTQKQSMILFEEVDVLFDEDKAFWTGVISLIGQSKRPIVLTCNDESSIPFDELPLHATWRYEAPTPDVVAEYLVTLAANEGHILGRDCVRALYKSKGYDLRATISELDFWCQMGIGSEKGGLDWMLDHSTSNGVAKTTDAPLRVFSKDTYVSGTGLDLSTHVSNDQRQEELLKYAQEYLEIPVIDWQEASNVLQAAQPSPRHCEPSQKRIDDLQQAVEFLDSRSVLDLFDDSLTAALSIRIATALTPDRSPLQEEDAVRAYFTKPKPRNLTQDELLNALEPMTLEKPTFPPGQGRLAPSFEGPKSIIATDIAPYVRSIVAFDQQLEQQRDVMTGDLQGRKVRKTRAARAALEGGSKANTRREKWFPATTDYEKVMKTAGKGWPLWVQDNDPGLTQGQELVEVSSPETSPNENEH